MTYDNFEDFIETEMLEKGLAYFESQSVKELENEEGIWSAFVMGSDEYEVDIEGKRNIKGWDCDCPYDHGDICKHVVAVLYAIKQLKTKKVEKKNRGKNPVDQIFTKVPSKELLSYFKKKVKASTDLRQKLESDFIDFIEAPEGQEKFAQLISKTINETKSNRYGYYDYKVLRGLSKKLGKINNKAMQLIANKNYLDALNICLNMIKEVSDLLRYEDDHGEHLHEVLANTHETINHLLDAPLPPGYRISVFDQLLQLLEELLNLDLYTAGDLLYLLVDNRWEEKEYKKLLPILTKLIAAAKVDDNDYSGQSYVKSLVEVYEKLNDPASVSKTIEKNINFAEIRRLLVEKLIVEKKYIEAKKVINEGISIAKVKNNSGTVSKWKEDLIKISNLEGDKQTLKKLLRESYLNGHRDSSDNLARYKKSFNKNEWLDERKGLILFFKEKHIESEKKNFWGNKYQFFLENLYIYEAMWPELLEYIQNLNSNSSYKAELASHLEEYYPQEVLDIYETYINDVIQRVDKRSSYRNLCNILIEVKKVKNGEDLVSKLAKKIRQVYHRRPAMIEELNMAGL